MALSAWGRPAVLILPIDHPPPGRPSQPIRLCSQSVYLVLPLPGRPLSTRMRDGSTTVMLAWPSDRPVQASRFGGSRLSQAQLVSISDSRECKGLVRGGDGCAEGLKDGREALIHIPKELLCRFGPI